MTFDDFAESMEQIEKESDRGLAILGAALIDNALKRALLAKMVPLGSDKENQLLEDNGPLAAMSARIQVLYAFGYISADTRDDLNTLKELRNAFAHARHAITFDTPVVAARCMQFKLRRLIHRPNDNRKVYTTAVMLLLVTLMGVIGPGSTPIDGEFAPEPSPSK